MKTTGISRIAVAAICLIVVPVVMVVAFCLTILLQDGGLAAEILAARIEQLDCVEKVELGGFYDNIFPSSFDIVELTIHLTGSGDRTITIFNPKPVLLEGGSVSSIMLADIGGIQLSWIRGRDRSTGYPDIGCNGEVGQALPVRISSLEDVILNYDALHSYFSSWPEYAGGLSIAGGTACQL